MGSHGVGGCKVSAMSECSETGLCTVALETFYREKVPDCRLSEQLQPIGTSQKKCYARKAGRVAVIQATSASRNIANNGGGGGFYLAGEDFERMFDNSFPASAFLKFLNGD